MKFIELTPQSGHKKAINFDLVQRIQPDLRGGKEYGTLIVFQDDSEIVTETYCEILAKLNS